MNVDDADEVLDGSSVFFYSDPDGLAEIFYSAHNALPVEKHMMQRWHHLEVTASFQLDRLIPCTQNALVVYVGLKELSNTEYGGSLIASRVSRIHC